MVNQIIEWEEKDDKIGKMELCMWYDANNDEELFNQRITAKDLCFDLNHLRPSDKEKRLEVIEKLLDINQGI